MMDMNNHATVDETLVSANNDQSNADTTAETVVKEYSKKRKIFFVSDMDKEADYLHYMSMEGYHFVSRKGITYTFELGEVKNYYYHLGYYEHGLRDNDRYISNFKEAGWKNIYHEKGEFDGMLHYFRTEEAPGMPGPEIFSERKSRKELYKRLLAGWRNLITIIIIMILFMLGFVYFLFTHPTIYQTIFLTIFAIVFALLVSTMLLYMVVYRKVKHKLMSFKYQ